MQQRKRIDLCETQSGKFNARLIFPQLWNISDICPGGLRSWSCTIHLDGAFYWSIRLKRVTIGSVNMIWNMYLKSLTAIWSLWDFMDTGFTWILSISQSPTTYKNINNYWRPFSISHSALGSVLSFLHTLNSFIVLSNYYYYTHFTGEGLATKLLLR